MDAKQINQTFDLVSYISGLVTLHKNGAYFIGPCPICGGRDRFNVKRTQTGDAWICRKCNPDKYHSALDFLMAYYHEDFKASLKRAGGDVQAPRREMGTGKPVTPPAPVQVVPDATWQADAWKQIDRASDVLIGEPDGEPGRRYLLSRGIDKGSIYASLLGYVSKVELIEWEDKPAVTINRPALVIPWLDIGNVVTAVKFRFIDELARRDHSQRFITQRGGMPYLFGLRDILASDKTLLFVEGELNAISVLQTNPRGVSVVSGGSDTNGNAALLQALARHYSRVVIWTDDPSKARTIRERMNQPTARLLQSPMIDGVKYDANQMLQAGLLAEFVSAEFATECRGVPMAIEVTDFMSAIAEKVSAATGER